MKEISQAEITKSQVINVIKDVFPDKVLVDVIDCGVWVHRNFVLVFNDRSKAFMKIKVHNHWLDSTINEAMLSDVLRSHGLPGPETLFLDSNGKHLGVPFLVQSELEGMRLSIWLSKTPPDEWPKLFSAVGDTYRRIHAIKGPSSGVWDKGPEKTLPISPNDFYFNAEIIKGSGKRAFDVGFISRDEFLKIKSIWKENLTALKDHTPSLVHGSPFPWTICLSEDHKLGFQVTRLNALGDFLWWDPAYDIAFLLYPPNFEWPEACKNSLVDAYGGLPETWRINLYAILQHLCALNDVYLTPADEPGPKISVKETEVRLKTLLTYF